MTSLNYQQNQIDEEALVQKIISKNSSNWFWWTICILVTFLVLDLINGLISIALPSSLNFHHQVSALMMFGLHFSIFCTTLYNNHRIVKDFKSHDITEVATIDYKLIRRSIFMVLAIFFALFGLLSVIDFMNPPF